MKFVFQAKSSPSMWIKCCWAGCCTLL